VLKYESINISSSFNQLKPNGEINKNPKIIKILKESLFITAKRAKIVPKTIPIPKSKNGAI
jgi:hypothetical protein